MANQIGLRTTNQPITETRIVRQVDKEMAELEPNLAPLFTFTTKMGGKTKPCKSPRVEWFEKELLGRWAQNGATTVNANASSTTITVTDGTLFVANDLGLIVQAGSVSTAPEMFRVTGVSGNALTVVRNLGSTGLRQLDADAAILILGQAHPENGSVVDAKIKAPVAKISYTEIFKKFLSYSETQLQTEQYASGGSERKRLQNDLMKEMKISMNQQFMFGVASEDLTGDSSGNPVRTTMGFNSVVTTNVYDAGGIFTRKGLEAFSRMAFRYSPGKKKLLLAAPLIVSAFHDWGNSFLQLKPMENVLGVDITRVRTGHGEWLLANDVTLEDGISGKNGFSGYGFSIDVDNVEQAVLRALTLKEDVVYGGQDGKVDEIIGELGLKVKLEKTHAKLYNVTDYQE